MDGILVIYFAFYRYFDILYLQMPSGSSLHFGGGNNGKSSEIYVLEDFFVSYLLGIIS